MIKPKSNSSPVRGVLAVYALVGIGYMLWPKKPKIQWTAKMIFQRARDAGFKTSRSKRNDNAVNIFKNMKIEAMPILTYYTDERKFYIDGYVRATIEEAGDHLLEMIARS